MNMSHLTKLNDENYMVWKYQIELLLIREDLWTVIVDMAPTDVTLLSAWNKKDAKARAHIGLCIEDNQIIHVKSKTTAKAMWEALKEYHQKTTLSNNVRLLRRICRMILPEGGNMQTHLNAMDECMDELATLGEPIADALSVAFYLSSLSESYSVLITALESRAEADLTKIMVKNKLSEEYRRRQEIDNVNESCVKALKVNKDNSYDTSKVYCFFCKKKGHLKAECRKFALWKKKKELGQKANIVQQNEEEDCVCLIVNHQNLNIHEWCVDSGASAHMCNDKTIFKILDTTKLDSVSLADGRKLSIQGTGIIEFQSNFSKIRLNEIQFVPELKCNLLSVSKLAKNGCSIIFKNEECEISKDGKVLIVVKSRNDVYKAIPKHQVFNTTQSRKSKCIHEWHKVLGHRNLTDIRKMIELSVNMKIENCEHNDICEICLQCKKTRDPFPHN